MRMGGRRRSGGRCGRRSTRRRLSIRVLLNAGSGRFRISAAGVYPRNEVYARVKGWASFEPWLSRIEGRRGCDLAGGGEIPPAWYGGSWDELEALVERLIARKAIVRELYWRFAIAAAAVSGVGE